MRPAVVLAMLAVLVLATSAAAHRSDAQAPQGPANGTVFPDTTTIVLEYDEPWFCTDCEGTVTITVATDPQLANVVDRASGPCPASNEPSCPFWTYVGPYVSGTYYWAESVTFANGEQHQSAVWSFTVTSPGAIPQGSYQDATGDSREARDVTGVQVSYDPPTGQIRVLASIPGFRTLAADEDYWLYIDADQDASTGHPFFGMDYYMHLRGASNTFGFYRWDGSKWVYSPSTGQRIIYRDGVMFVLNRSDLGGGRISGFNFLVESDKTTNGTNVWDQVPDASVLNFQLPAQAETNPAPVTAPALASMTVKALPATPTAGLPFRVVPTVKLTTGTSVTPDKLTCVAHIGKATVRGSGRGRCTLSVPRTAGGKLLIVRVVAGYKGSSITKTLRYKVRRA
jgi:hypothetical protein